MTNRTKFIIGILLLLGVVFAIEYRMTRKFVWIPTFSHTDAQPFGCMLFDSVMQASMPQGYTVSKKTIRQMRQDSVFNQMQSLLVVTNEAMSDGQMADLLRLAENGHTVMVATSALYQWTDTLDIDYRYGKTFNLKDIVGKDMEKRDLGWPIKDEAYADRRMHVSVYRQLIGHTLIKNDSVECELLLSLFEIEFDEEKCVNMPRVFPVALSFKRGKGELILVSSPLLFTNYMTICGRGYIVQGRLMNRLKAHPVIRMESYMSATAMTESSQFYVFLQQPPLRWALYLTILAILLFCIFTARRRQRVIPVIQKPQNRNLEFVKLIGSLYWQQHDNASLLAKKLAFATEQIRQHNVPLAAEDEELLKEIREYAYGNYVIPDKTLKYYINELNRIQKN